jgi:hypothetical protein
LPFTDGTTKNQGLINDEFITSIDPTFSNDGKLGKCLEQGQFDMSATMTSKILNNQALTICFWIYVNAEEGSKGGTIFGNINTNVEFNNRKFSIFQYPTCNDLHLSWMNDAANAFMMTPIYKGVLPSYQWTHVAITYHNPTMTVYINGIKKYTYSSVSNSSSFEYQTRVVWQNAYRKLNDFRIYNECLSPRQVKEISKGLVCHYPMGNVDGKIGGRNLLVKTNQGKINWSNSHADGSYSCESVNWNGINAVKMSCTTPTTSWKMFTFNGLLENFDKLEPSAIYTLSYDVIGNIKVGFSNLWDSGATHSIIVSAQETVIKKTYGFHYIVNITLKDALNKSRQVVYFTNNLKAGESVIIANLKLEKGNKATAYTPCPTDDPVMYDNMIYDTSGYCNNGSVTDSTCPTWSSDTPRYKGSYVFNGNNQYLKFQNPITSSSTDFTISCWVKFDDTTGNSTICTMRTAVGNGIALFKIGNKIRFDDNAQFTFSDYTISANAWTHVVVTRLSSCKKLYVNGILKQTVNTVGDMKLISNVGTIGASSQGGDGISNYLNGQLSDFRIYATALDNQTIEELYKVGASVDSSGNLMLAGEVVEE